MLARRTRLSRRSCLRLGDGLAGEMRFVGRDPLLHHLAPRRIALALVEQRAPILDRRCELSVLLLGDGEQDARLDAESGSSATRALERAARFLAHHPVIGEHERLALSRQTLRRLARAA